MAKETDRATEAAETIRHYLSDEFDDYSEAFAAVDVLVAEAGRLREALELIASPRNIAGRDGMKDIARAALAAADPEASE